MPPDPRCVRTPTSQTSPPATSPAGSLPTASAPLGGLRILDLSRVLAGPYATQLLGDLGAEVWKIERPGDGDETRAWGPPFVAGESAYFLSVNRNKRSAALDFGLPDHRNALRRAALASDVVVENFLPGALARHGLDAASLRAERPELVVCSITGYGQDGPYATFPGYDAVLQGFVGLMSITGEEDGPPLKVGVAMVDVMTGAHAAAAILAALVGRARGGPGVHLDVALSEVGLASLVNVAQAALASGVPARRHGNAHPQIVPYQTFQAADAAMVVAVGNDQQWRRLCEAMERPDWANNTNWARNPDRVLHRRDVVPAIAARIAEHPRKVWLDRLRQAEVPAGPVRDILEAVQDPAVTTRDFKRRAVLKGENAPVDLLALPWRTNAARPALHRPPPRLGEHTEEFLAQFTSV